MTDGLKDSHRNAIIDILSANKRIERVVLFGSRAMGTYTMTSDVDLVLYGDHLTLTDQAHLADALDKLTVPQRVDLMLYDAIDNDELCKHIERHGVEWYRRQQDMGIESAIDITAEQRKTVLALLEKHLPNTTTWVYGSRAKWTARPQSDLDMVVFATREQSSQVFALREAFAESNLPFRVDLFVWDDVPERFRKRIKQDYVVFSDNANDDPVGRNWLYHPQFPRHWKRKPLHAMAQWVNGLTFREIQFSTTGKPVIKIAEIKGGISGQTKFTQQTFDESVRIRPGDLLFSWSGQPETSIDTFWWRGPEGWLNQHVFRVTPINGVDSIFFFYLLRYLKPNFVAIARNKQTTGLGHVTKRDLENIEAALPDLSEQRAIAHILGTLDDKIELNRRMNETLEGMARGLFKSWFVDFEPVRVKMEGRDTGLPPDVAVLFPDRLVESELGGIPEGWEVGVLDDAIELLSGGTPRTSVASYWDGGIPWYTAKDAPSLSDIFALETERTITQVGVENSSTKILPVGTTIITARGTVGRLACLGIPMAMNQTCYGIQGAQGYPDFFTYWAVRKAVDELQSRTHGTIFDTITRQTFKIVDMVLPPVNVTEAFECTVNPIMERILNNLHESQTLAALRDTLLPKLLAGELQIKEVL